jgi:hypothetical protein
MLPLKQLIQFLLFLPQQFKSQDDQAKNKDKQADTVNTMHVTDPFAFRPLGILSFKVKIFRDLIPDSHVIKSKCKSKNAKKIRNSAAFLTP